MQRQRWLTLARAEAEAAAAAGEAVIARAFEAVRLTVETDRIVEPPTTTRRTLKGRDALYAEAIRLGQSGMTSREVAVLLGIPRATIYAWLREVGLVKPRFPREPEPVGSA